MLVAIFGESCTGKSTLAGMLKERLGGEIWTGKDYLRLAKDEAGAKKLFTEKLREAVTGGPLIYVIAEKEHLSLLPEGAVRGRQIPAHPGGEALLDGRQLRRCQHPDRALRQEGQVQIGRAHV